MGCHVDEPVGQGDDGIAGHGKRTPPGQKSFWISVAINAELAVAMSEFSLSEVFHLFQKLFEVTDALKINAFDRGNECSKHLIL